MLVVSVAELQGLTFLVSPFDVWDSGPVTQQHQHASLGSPPNDFQSAVGRNVSLGLARTAAHMFRNVGPEKS
jgi:hypothetical protein